MQYRTLGATGLRLSVVGYGASPFGNVFGDTDRTEGIAAVHYAIDHGINFFDVSPYYGLTLAETRLGEALAGRRAEVVLATKCGRYGAEEFDFSAQRIKREFDQSLGRLRTDFVDLLQAHDVEFAPADQIVEETIPAMRELQQQGKARYIGITGYSPKNLVAIAKRAKVDSILTYCRYNLMVADIDDELIPFAKEHGIGVINASPLHMGILTERGAPPWHPAPEQVQDVGKKVVELCLAEGVNAPELALRFCVDHPYIASTLVGMATREQVKGNIAALALEGYSGLLQRIGEMVAPGHNRIWRSGLAENHG